MSKNTDETKELVHLFFEIGNLRKIPRAHQQTLLSQDLSDNIASHSFRTAFIGYFLAKHLKINADKVLKMCLLHDLEETRCGDQNWVHKKYLKVFEDEIRKEQLGSLFDAQELLELSKEYDERKTVEAKTAKDADLLDQILILKEYLQQGNQEAKRWLRLGENKPCEHEKMLSTFLAKKIAKEIKKQEPSDWWSSAWTSKRR
ncbi:MAG: HD domain-containing protein [bacterium]|nr:HD domain-containing protein [bacterium]